MQNHADQLLGGGPGNATGSAAPKPSGRLYEIGAQIDSAHAVVDAINEQIARLALL
jgi:hypothetical protein